MNLVRLAELAFLACLAVRFATGEWPWQRWPQLFAWLSPADPAAARVRQARTLLGLGEGASRADIIDAHRRLITQVHPDRGGSSAAVIEANAARDLLLERLGPANRG